MTADLFVVHLVPRGATGVRSGWDTPNGRVRHQVVSWSHSPPTLSDADIVVAHGLAPLVVAQAVVGVGPQIVYRPVSAGRLSRRRLRNGLHADWVAAPTRRLGRITASALGLDRRHITVFRNDDRVAWDSLTSELIANARPELVDVLPRPTRAQTLAGWSAKALSAVRREDSTRNRADVDDTGDVDGNGDATAPERGAEAPGAVNVRPVAPVAPVAAREVVEPVPTVRASQPAAPAAPAAPPVAAPPAVDVPADVANVAAGAVAGAAAAATAAPKLSVGVAGPTSPGLPWWKYRPLDVPGHAADAGLPNAGLPNGGVPHGGAPNGAAAKAGGGNGRAANGGALNRGTQNGGAGPTKGPPPGGSTPARFAPGGSRPPVQIVAAAAQSGVGFFVLGIATLVVIAGCTQIGTIGEGPFLIPLAGLFLTLAAARRIARTRPDEEWVGNWLVLGLTAKLLASYFRYYTLIHTYNGLGDAADYDKVGREYANHWLNGSPGPVLYSQGLRKTNFVRWFTGVTYYSFGSKLLTGTFVFALLALIGSYLWYRATVDSVPFIDRKLYFAFVMFAPSIVFWPSIVGKEALMQFALGVTVIGAAFLLRQKLVTGLVIAAGGGWLLWVVRPHLLALVAIATGAAYFAGRVRKQGKKASFVTRPIGIIIIAFLVAFTIAQGAQFLGISSLSVSSIQAELNSTTESTSQGGSSFKHGGNSLSPLAWPMDAVTVFLRPFPWEVESSLQILASLESVALGALIVIRFKSLRSALSRSRESPFLMLCWVLTALYAITFASFANFGLLVRERSLVFPAILVLLSVDPLLAARQAKQIPQPELPSALPVEVPSI